MNIKIGFLSFLVIFVSLFFSCSGRKIQDNNAAQKLMENEVFAWVEQTDTKEKDLLQITESDNENNPKVLAQRSLDLIMQLEGRDDKDPAAAEELRMVWDIVEKLSEEERDIFNKELERLYIGEE